jgi:hypothetical protein
MAIRRVNDEGVILDYHPDALGPHHRQPYSGLSGRDRVAFLRSERELNRLEIIFDHLDLSDIAADRVWYALRAVRHGLERAAALSAHPAARWPA